VAPQTKRTPGGLIPLLPPSPHAASRKRVFSLGLSSLEMNNVVCGGECGSSGTYALPMSIRCTTTAVRFRVIPILTVLEVQAGVPVHGEVCPGNWIYHRVDVPDNDVTRGAGGLRFSVHVSTGEVYFALSRWVFPPSFASCNENEYAMSYLKDGHVDLCGVGTYLEDKANSEGIWGLMGKMSGEGKDGGDGRRLAKDEGAAEDLLPGYVGLYGGTECAHYTIEAEYLPADAADTCSTDTTGSCQFDAGSNATRGGGRRSRRSRRMAAADRAAGDNEASNHRRRRRRRRRRD
jgi:hypothetical protein